MGLKKEKLAYDEQEFNVTEISYAGMERINASDDKERTMNILKESLKEDFEKLELVNKKISEPMWKLINKVNEWGKE